MLRSLFTILTLAFGLCGLAAAQTQGASRPAAASSAAAGATQSANILDLNPDASADPKYAQQSNGERATVQPGNNAPMWRQVGSGITGTSSLPRSQAPEAGNLVQPSVRYPGSRLTNAGEAWREVRNKWIIPYGGALLLIVIGAIALFHWRIGPMKVKDEPTGRLIERFTYMERSAHWANAVAFCTLAISGVVMAFGKFFLLPVIGTTLFGWLAYLMKNVHNFSGPVFAVSLLVVIVTFVGDNLPSKDDLNWLLKAGGILSGQEIESGRFNAGEKITFWGGVFLLGLIVVASGLFMDKLIPGLIYERASMQVAHMVHAASNIAMLCMFLGHIYMGTAGTKGAYEGMRTGYVDESWAREHHALWYADVQSGKLPAQRSVTSPAGSAPSAVQV